MKLERTKICHNRTQYHWTPELYEYVLTEHWDNKRTLKSIGEELDIPYSSLQLEMRRAGLPRRTSECRRKHDVNAHYFDQIDTPAKAYWLGFLYADGYVHTECSPYNVVFIQTDKDSASVYKLAKALEYTGPIRKSHHSYSKEVQHRLDVHCKTLIAALDRAGCVYLKESRRFPSLDILPAELQWHFVRGLFDGDGSLHRSPTHSGKSWHYQMALDGSYELLESIGTLIGSEQVHIRKLKHVSDEVNSFEMRIWKHGIISDTLSHVYEDTHDGIRLGRKYQKYLEFKQYYISRAAQQ